MLGIQLAVQQLCSSLRMRLHIIGKCRTCEGLLSQISATGKASDLPILQILAVRMFFVRVHQVTGLRNPYPGPFVPTFENTEDEANLQT